MALTLEQYANFLDTRDLTWPQPPPAQPARARPHVIPLPDVRVIAWNTYGTLLSIATGSLVFEHPQRFVMDIALDKTVQEFKMWGSMSRKPGQPAEYMGHLYQKELDLLKMAASPGEKFPEIHAEKIWEGIVKKLLQKEYKFDAGFFGSLNEYSRKIAYFFHASLQGTACYEGMAELLEGLQTAGIRHGLLGDSQCFTMVQLQRGLANQHSATHADILFDKNLRSLSYEVGGRKPSERLFKHFLNAAQTLGIRPENILHVSSRISQDLIPAKKFGMRTAFFAGDKESLQATPDQLKDPNTRPDIMITEFSQLMEAFTGE